MNKLITTSLLVCITITGHALETYLTMENDTFLKRADNDYTHGTKLEAIEAPWHFQLSQMMYAPSDLRKEYHIPGDRPYCGMILGGVGYEFLNDPETPWSHYGELDFGMIGPASFCKETQTFIHKILGCRKPMGWDNNQLHNEIVINGQWWTKYNYYVTDWFAVVPKVGVAAGNIQDMVEGGLDIKLGYNLKKTANPNNTIMFSAGNPNSWQNKLSAYVFAGVSEKYFLYNHILEGSMFNHKDDDINVDIERFVTEFRTGIVVRYDRFYASYYAVFRTDEFKNQPNRPDYGGFCVGWTW